MASGMYPHSVGEIAARRAVQIIDGSSRKEYLVSVARDADGTYTVIGSWGRIGSVNQHKVYASRQSPQDAVADANTLLDGKTARGYGPLHAPLTVADLTGVPAPPTIVAAPDDDMTPAPIADMLFA